MHIAYITAGGAGMFCGSCMQDNALARALMQAGHEVSLIPTYTPLRLDEQNVANTPVFLGGINLYLDNSLPGWRYLPRYLVSWLDRPTILQWATSRGIENDARKLGRMTLAMLDGASGAMKREYLELTRYINSLKPDVVLFTNTLLAGVLPILRKTYAGPIHCFLQGDDIFLDSLLPEFCQSVINKIQQLSQHFDGYITHTRFYADYMSDYLGLPREKIVQIPLAIDATDVPTPEITPAEIIRSDSPHGRLKIGYFARIAPEKGLRELVKAALILNKNYQEFELLAGGYLGPQHASYLQEVQDLAAPLGSRFQYVGSPVSRAEKFEFLKSLDLFSVPAQFLEPKGIYLLEAMSVGLPVVQPKRGSYVELIESTGGGVTFEHGNLEDHAQAMHRLITDTQLRRILGENGLKNVRKHHRLEAAAEKLLEHASLWVLK